MPIHKIDWNLQSKKELESRGGPPKIQETKNSLYNKSSIVFV